MVWGQHDRLMERTLILCKPDCMQKNLAGEVIRRLEASGLTLAAAKMLRLDAKILAEHYAHIADRPFFPEIVEFMSSRPVLALILNGDGAVARVRALLGPTDSRKAEKGTLRGDLGENNMRNVVHASDSPENAEVEVRRFFRPEEIPA